MGAEILASSIERWMGLLYESRAIVEYMRMDGLACWIYQIVLSNEDHPASLSSTETMMLENIISIHGR